MLHRFGRYHLGVVEDPAAGIPSLQECLRAVLEHADDLMDDVLRALQAAVRDSGSRWTHAALDEQGQAVVQTLCDQEVRLKQRFAHALEQALYHGIGEGRPSATPIGQGDLRWLDLEQIDQHIETALAEHEVLSAVQDQLPQVHACMATLMGWQSAQPDLHPLRPQVFAHAMRQAMAQVLGQEGLHRAVATQAAAALGASLRQFYRELLAWLLSAGVEPAALMAGGSSALGGGESAASHKGRRTQLTLDKLRRLLAGDAESPAPGSGVEFSLTVPAAYFALEDLQLLEPLMQRLAQRARPGVSTLEPASSQESERVGLPLGKQLGQEVALLMLERFVQDPRLLPAMRRSLHALQPVLLRLARHDARFFSERTHPARQYLECVIQRSLAYQDEQHPDMQRLLRDIEAARRMLRQGGGDAPAFAQALQQLQATWARREARQRDRAQAAERERLQARRRQALVQHWAQQLGARLPHQTEIPACVASFVCGPWAQVLAQAQLDGATARLQDYTSLVDDLAWSVSPQRAARDRSRLLRLVPAMLASLREGLALIAYPSDQMVAFFDALIVHHERIFDSRELLAAPDEGEADAPHAVVLEPDADTAACWQDSPLDEGVLVLPVVLSTGSAAPVQVLWSFDTLPIGTWVELMVAQTWVRAQLTWASPRRTLFMFISGAGLAHALSRRTLERRYQQGLVRGGDPGAQPVDGLAVLGAESSSASTAEIMAGFR